MPAEESMAKGIQLFYIYQIIQLSKEQRVILRTI